MSGGDEIVGGLLDRLPGGAFGRLRGTDRFVDDGLESFPGWTLELRKR